MALNSHQSGPAVIIVGAQGCGKTCLVNRFVDQVYNEQGLATIGLDVLFLGEQPCGLKPSLWDASGHQRFGHIIRGYLAGAKAALLVYDVTNRASLDSAAADWLAALREEAPADLVTILVGAKADCPPHQRQVTAEAAASFASRHGLHACLEASAKTGEGVGEVFEELFSRLLARARPPWSAAADAASAEPLILPSAGGRGVGGAGKPGQWSLGTCFSAVGQLLCRRARLWR